MTYRKRIIIGLIAGLAVPAGVRAADYAAWQKPAPARSSARDTGTQSNNHNSNASSKLANWQPSEEPAAADVRFKKPELPLNRDGSEGAAKNQPAGNSAKNAAATSAVKPASGTDAIAKPSRLPATSAASERSSAPARIEITDAAGPPARSPAFSPSIAATPAARQPASLSSLLAPAVEQKAALTRHEQPASAAPDQLGQPAASIANAAAASASPSEPSSFAAAQDAKQSDVRLDDEQLKRVAQILNDSYVLPAAQEEPLPGTPNADPLRGANADDYSDRGPAPYDGDSYYGDCCPPPPRLFWVAGVEATFLSPDINTTGRASWAVEDVDESRDEVYTTEDIDSVYLSPRIWIGVQGCAWGANLRYWHFNASENHFDPSIGQAGTWDGFDCGRPNVGFFSMSRLEAYTIDLELTRRFCLHDCQMQGSVGVRHADVQFAESITGTALASDANLFGYAEAERYTRGTGLVFGLYGRKPLFPCSCIHWYYNLRWSALWGPTRTAVETGATALSTGANAGSVNGAYTCVDDNLFIGEIQLGLEWNYALQCVPANAFFRAGVEYQRWTGGIGYSEAGSFAGIEIDDEFAQIGSTFASAAAPELDLIGLTIGTGLTW